MLAPQSPGPLLRTFRLARRISQEELANRAEISPRHLSCLENGRARPSHSMVLVLGSALDLPLRERNTLLLAAGFAPVYRASALDDPAMAHVHQAITRLLRVHEPHPAILLDRGWNVLRLNEGAARLFGWLKVRPNMVGPLNIHRLAFDEAVGVRPHIVNFDAVADGVLERLRTEVGVDPSLQGLLTDLERLRGPARSKRVVEAAPAVALPLHLRREGQDLRYFTTLTTLGTPMDVTAQELRIEGYFPMDEETDAFGHKLAKGDG